MSIKAMALWRVTFALFCSSLMWVLGCSNRHQPTTDQPAGGQKQGLTSFTVSLNAPNPLSPIDPVLLASTSVTLGSAANVVSGTIAGMSGIQSINIGSAGLVNETWSRGQALLGSSAKVRGTLHASDTLLGPDATATTFDRTPRFDPVSTLSWSVVFPDGTGNDVNVPPGGTQTLAPGRYQNVTVNDRANLRLASGTYFLTGLNLATNQSTVTLDQANGPIIIYVSTTLSVRGKFSPPAGAPAFLLVGYFGTSQISLGDTGVPFSGALIAPFANVQFQAITGAIHTGFFAAPMLTLAAGAQVQYQRPLAVITAANPGGIACSQLMGDAGIPPQDLAQFCTKGPCVDDTDFDGIPDCADGCPYDQSKKAAGICGCNIPDRDTDGDGVPDCKDLCPADPNNITPGQCGCVGQPDLVPAGVSCTDTACPQSGATCNGGGQCGNRSTCRPCTGGRLVMLNATSYWFCGNPFPPQIGSDGGVTNPGSGSPASQSTAQQACSAKGLTLTRIDTPDENRFIAQFLTIPLWLGANDITTSDQWRWSKPNSVNGDLFWVGGPSGSRQNNRYVNWSKTAPGPARCASMRPGDGLWFDTPCTELLGYVCSFDAPPPSAAPDSGTFGAGPSQPVPMPTDPCVDEFALDGGGLPDSLLELANELDAAAHDVFIGAAANPPPDGSTCPSEGLGATASNAIGLGRDSGAGCAIIDIRDIVTPDGNPDGGPGRVDCLFDNECKQAFGAEFLCRQLKDEPSCSPPDAGATSLDAGACRGHSSCVRLQCPLDPAPCKEIRVCQPGSDFDAGPDPATNLDAGSLDPRSMFNGGVVDATPVGEYIDPPDGSGANHTWCHMVPQHETANADKPPLATNGSTGQGSPIHFTFDPNLVFDVKANPLALGESNLGVHAAATLKTSVELRDFLGQNYSADVVELGAGVRAQRCSIDNAETQFVVLGVDVIPLLGIGVPHFDSAERFPDQTKSCNDAIENFTLWANRAKKAFRDAQQLLTQYKAAKTAGKELANTLCQAFVASVDANDVPFFPGGLVCPVDEPVEVTINRFLQYFQAPGIGQISQLRAAAANLVTKSQALVTNALNPLKQGIKFKDRPRNESQTILNVPFAIGPVPMVLQVDVFAAYGITGTYTLDLDFPLAQMAGLDDTRTVESDDKTASPFKLVRMEAAVLPYARAGLSAFVGAGTDLGVFSASVGIEGAVNLATVQAPIYAGAGLDLLMTFDRRSIPGEIAGVSVPGAILGSTFQFGVPKSFNFLVWFDYGAALDLQNVLSGEINGKLRIKFLFFSKTWRKRIVKFNGWHKHFNLISGGFGAGSSTNQPPNPGTKNLPPLQGSTTVVTTESQGPSLGFAEMQLPLTVLQPLDIPPAPAEDAGPPDVQTVPFDASAVQSFFYDNQCCAHNQETCNPAGTPQCCPDFDCVARPGGSHSCEPRCIAIKGACRQGAAVGCCDPSFCGPSNSCQTCLEQHQPCDATQGCCSGLFCTGGACEVCASEGQPCNADQGQNCCEPLLCGPGGTCLACVPAGNACGSGTICCGDATCPDAGTQNCCFPPGHDCKEDNECCGSADKKCFKDGGDTGKCGRVIE